MARTSLRLLVVVALVAAVLGGVGGVAVAADGSISGRVGEGFDNQGNFQPLELVDVFVFDAGTGTQLDAATTNASGLFSFTLAPGTYKLKFEDNIGDFAFEYYNNELSLAAADVVTVTSGSNTSVGDVILQVGGNITGVVTGQGSGTLSAVQVVAFNEAHGFQSSPVLTAIDGTYSIIGLPAGAYKVRFADTVTAPPRPYQTEWYNDKVNQSSATPVTVTSDTTTAGINAVLTLPAGVGTISGTVTDLVGGKLPGIRVEITDPTSPYAVIESTTTDNNGGYAVTGLPSDRSYFVHFVDPDGVLAPQWHDDSPAPSGATAVQPPTGGVATVNAQMAIGGSITGTVTQQGTGATLRDIVVTAAGDNGQTATDTTDVNGFYSIIGLAAGSFTLSFTDPSGDHVSATLGPVVLGSGDTSNNNDIALARAGAIAGTVTDELGAPVDDIVVDVYLDAAPAAGDPDPVASTVTAPDGSYHVGALAAGTYDIEFSDPNGTYLMQRVEDRAVTAGQTTIVDVVLDFVITPFGSIEGFVTAEVGGAALGGIEVTAYEVGGGAVKTTVSDGVVGDYELTDLLPGSYQVLFHDPGGLYEDEWYNNAAVRASANTVIVVRNSAASNINGTLNQADISPPTWPGGTLSVTAKTRTTVTLSWSAATDDRGVTAYRIFRNGAQVAEVGVDPRTYTAALLPGVLNTFKVEAGDAKGNWSTTGPSVDVAAPSALVDWVRVSGDFNGDGLMDVAQFDPATGEWQVGLATGTAFNRTLWATVSTTENWTVHRVGDFNNDGNDDIASFDNTTASWWVLQSTGTAFTSKLWADFASNAGWIDHVVGDFNNDGRDDIANFHDGTARWWVSLSTGTSFSTKLWADFASNANWVKRLVGDFNKDGRDDIANYHIGTGRWWVSLSTGTKFTTVLWADFVTPDGWTPQIVGDFNGDGFDDIGNYHTRTGRWYMSISDGTKFVTKLWADFVTPDGWEPQLVLDATGDGMDDIAAFHRRTARWYVGVSRGNGFTMRLWATFVSPTSWTSQLPGDYTGDGRDDVAQFHPPTGRWYVSRSTGSSFSTKLWDQL